MKKKLTTVPRPPHVSEGTWEMAARQVSAADLWRIRAQVDTIRRRRRRWLGGQILESAIEDHDEWRRAMFAGTYAGFRATQTLMRSNP